MIRQKSSREYAALDMQTESDMFSSTPHKQTFIENWTALNVNPKSKMIKHFCDHYTCVNHPDHDPRGLIKNGYNLGFRRCSLCGYFKTKDRNCPCCNRQMRGTMRQKNHPQRKSRKIFVEY